MGSPVNARGIFADAKIVFWDFDGVVKESVDEKTRAYVQLFQQYGADVAEQIRRHHEAHGGMTRMEKFPLYLRWAGEDPSPGRVAALCEEFGDLVREAVIDCAWVPGAEALIRENPYDQRFVLVSATPQDELDGIVDALGIRDRFTAVFGAPTSKADAIRSVLRDTGIPSDECLMIGDARADMDAAAATGVPFLLRRHSTNAEAFRDYHAAAIQDLSRL
jgi:phosphoglycolate phosphatase-like HAD superfamily hydrolase